MSLTPLEEEGGEVLVESREVPIISATGSTRMGRAVGPKVAERFGRTILELGGNNAMIVAPSADMEMALRAIVFSAVGTTGQRCTSLRRLIVHEGVYDQLIPRLRTAYETLPIGDPLADGILVGPLIDGQAYEGMARGIAQAQAESRRALAVANEHFDDPQLEGHVSVYLPESYNFAGNLIVVPRERVRPLDADGAEFMAFIVSGGVTDMNAAKTAIDRG